MNQTLKLLFTVFLLQFTYHLAVAQIIVNGHNPSKFNRGNSGPKNALSISYGSVIWVDGKNIPLAGYSAPLAMNHTSNLGSSVENNNFSFGLNAGYERLITDYLALRLSFTTARLINGITAREDLITYDKSRISQLGIYSRYSLSKNLKRRVQAQWLAGPELIYVKKDVLVDDYVTAENTTPQQYHQDVTITEGALVTGLGLSIRVSNNVALFGDLLGGISLPGGGLKFTNSGLGLRVGW